MEYNGATLCPDTVNPETRIADATLLGHSRLQVQQHLKPQIVALCESQHF